MSIRYRVISRLLILSACTNSGLSTLNAAGWNATNWPTYRGDNTRSSHLRADLDTQLKLIWKHSPGQAPRPAWPAPARGSYWQRLSRIASRVIDDHTFHPVVADGRVLFSSSADDSVYCLELATGRLLWQFTTDGPVRYAPTVHRKCVFVGSDDGSCYCLGLPDGNLIWQRQLAPDPGKIPGNGRLISPWPVRTGVIADAGVAYVAAGLYPSQGVHVYALNATDGMIVWRETVDFTAHGYLLLLNDRLIVPTGRGTPIVLSRATGQLLGQLPGSPGSYAVVTDNELITGRGNDGALAAAEFVDKPSLVSFRAEQICVTPDASYLLGDDRLVALDLTRFVDRSRKMLEKQTRQEELAGQIKELRETRSGSDGSGNDEVFNRLETEQTELSQAIRELESQRSDAQRWRVDVPGHGILAAATNAVAIAGDGIIQLRDPRNGRLSGQWTIEGRALGMAIAAGHLVVSTDKGELYCFGAGANSTNQESTESETPDEYDRQPWTTRLGPAIAALQREFGSTAGYALVIGGQDPQLIETLVQSSDLTIVVVEDDSDRVDTLRKRLLGRGIYGSRVAVHRIAPGRLPFADYFANLVISSRGMSGERENRWDLGEIRRLVRPFGGLAWLHPDPPLEVRGPLPGAGGWVHQYGNTGNTAASDNTLITPQLQLQWFGGPGPSRMVDRHLRAPAPLAAGGRMFVPAENAIVCTDSFNGTEYWQLDVPGSQRYSMPYDCGYFSTDGDRFAIAVRDQAWLVDAHRGLVRQKYDVPRQPDNLPGHWGYCALRGARIIGSVQNVRASRAAPSREAIDRDYQNGQPLVTGRSVFALDLADGSVIWEHRALVLNPTISIANDHIYFVAARDESLLEHATGRLSLAELMKEGANVIAIHAETGQVVWKQRLDSQMARCRNILYLQATDDHLVLSGSYTDRDDSRYRVTVLNATSGETLWSEEHAKDRAGEFSHGEQVHHPVILSNRLIAEPMIYNLENGQRLDPSGKPADWRLKRPGHSCGTMSGAGHCLLFRADNPTLLDLTPTAAPGERMQKISPTRPGCWINIIPADGLVLIPEASASCVCHYSLQTSMAFRPVPPVTATPDPAP